MAHVVKAAAVVIKGAGYLYRGALVPESADADDVKRLTAEGFLAKEEAVAAESVESKSVDKMTATELKAYAAEKGIELGDATKVGDMRTVIQAAEAAAPDPDPDPDAPEGDTGDGSDE